MLSRGSFLSLRCIRLLNHAKIAKVTQRFYGSTQHVWKTDDRFHPSTASFSCRRATTDDYEQVMKLRDSSKLFGGYDNLPDRYHMFICNPINRGYVLLHENNVAGFMVMLMVDDSETAVPYSLRIAEQFEGLHAVRAFLSLVFRDLDYAEYFSACIDSKTQLKHSAGFFVDNGDLTIQHKLFPFKSSQTILNGVDLTIKENCDVKMLNQRDLKRIFNEPDLARSLFPDDRILRLWCPFRLLSSNVPLIMDQRTISVGSYLNKHEEALLTLGTYSKTRNGLFCNIDLYGNPNRKLKEHMMLHIQHVLPYVTSQVTFELSVNVKSPSSVNNNLMSDIGLEEITQYGNYDLFGHELNMTTFLDLLSKK